MSTQKKERIGILGVLREIFNSDYAEIIYDELPNGLKEKLKELGKAEIEVGEPLLNNKSSSTKGGFTNTINPKEREDMRTIHNEGKQREDEGRGI